MDIIVDRLSAIELAASRIIDSAEAEKKRLRQQSEKLMADYDRDTDRETQEQLKTLRKELAAQVADELSQAESGADEIIRRMEADYSSNHASLAKRILQNMIKE